MTATPINFIRYAADVALSVPSKINLRPYTITLKTITWTGGRQGLGTSTETTQSIFIDGYTNPKFRQVSKEDIVLSGGLLKDQDAILGPIVFPYNTGFASGGTDPLTFSPSNSSSKEFYINVQGPNFPVGGVNYKKTSDTTDKNVLYRVNLRAVAPLGI